MNAYLLSHLPLAAGFALIMAAAALWPRSRDRYSHAIAVAALSLSAVFTALYLMPGQEFFGGAIRVTVTGKTLAFLALALALVAVVLAEDYLPKVNIPGSDFRLVVLAQALGLAHLPLSGDLATLFIAFELVSVPSYVLAGFNHRDARANEAGMKYLLLGVFASALLLLGLSFLYGVTGELHLAAIQAKISVLAQQGAPDLVLAKASLAFILAALFFKTGCAPFHFWLPDVYHGSNLASLAFLAAPAKVAVFGLLGLMLWGPFAALHATWTPYLLVAAAASALFGNLQAVSQSRLKRLLAYSSVANAGFILLSLLLQSGFAFLFYLAAYGITTLGLIAAFMVFGTSGADVEEIADLRELGQKHPLAGAAMTWVLFSLAGIPLTAGFAAKFAVAAEAFKPGFVPAPGFLPVLIASVVLGLVSFFFYFKMVRALWLPEGGAAAPEDAPRVLGWNAVFVLAFSAAAILGLGVLMRLPGMGGP